MFINTELVYSVISNCFKRTWCKFEVIPSDSWNFLPEIFIYIEIAWHSSLFAFMPDYSIVL